MLCCLNPVCHNPPVPDNTKFCPNCGVPLVILKNRYCPIKSLGNGGFGKTYCAEDIDKLHEKCVIKQFAPQVQGTAGVQKATELFEQEARRLQQLGEHSQIPTLLAYFKEDNRLYLVQQFVDGQNLLQELQQQGTFSEVKIRSLLQDLLNILSVVHHQKVIHRDIKPENIIQRHDGKLVLIDFGASKQLTQTVVSYKGTMIGSFGYAPLEQMQGGEVTCASDLFSLGATCFHLLTKIHPWELWKSQGYGWVENWKQHLQQPISKELELIIDKLLIEDYHQRYQSTDEVLQDLNRKPVGIKPTIISQRRKLSASRVFIIFVIIMFSGVGVVYSQKQQQEKDVETQASINNFSARLDNSSGLNKYNKKDYRGAIEDYNKAIELNPKYAEAYYNRGNARNAGVFFGATEAIEDYTQAIKINPNYVDAYNNRGNARYSLGNKLSAIEDYTSAIKIDPNYSIGYYNRGNVYRDLENYSAAIENYNQAIKINPKYADAYNNRGLARYNSGVFFAATEAIEDYTQAIKINPNFVDAYNNRGNARSNLGNKLPAIEDYSSAIKINPNHSISYYNRGSAYSDLKNYSAAIEDYNQAIKINSNYTSAYNRRGLAFYYLKNYLAAIIDYTSAISIDSKYAGAYYNRGLASNALGNKQEAIQDYRKAADLYKQQGKDSRYKETLKEIQQLEINSIFLNKN